jgi:hypothetical protein
MTPDDMSTLMPAAPDAALLRACVQEGVSAHAAWETWIRLVVPGGDDGEIIRALAARNAFAPILHWNLARNGVETGARLRTYLRSAAVTEELRCLKYRKICSKALQALNDAGVAFLVLKGAALSEQYYPSPFLRHSGDIDLLLRQADLTRAGRLLVEKGWRRERITSLVELHHRHTPPLVHPSGLPLELHRRLAATFYSVPYEELWARSTPMTIAGANARVLSAADNLLHICLHAMGGRRGLQWVVDAMLLVERAPDLDWAGFVATARASRAGLPVHAVLQYLADHMAVRVPEDVLAETRDAAAASGFLARRAARPIPVGTPDEIWTSPLSRLRRLARLWERAFPSPLSLALQFDIPVWQIPVEYLHRTVRVARYLASNHDAR